MIPSYVQLLEKKSSSQLPLFTSKTNEKKSSKNLQFPTNWNSKDKSQFLDVSHGNLRIVYQGSGKTDMDAAAVRSNCAVPPQCGIYYFEVKIISKGREGFIGIGFCDAHVPLGRLPGWEDFSWGYHGDDGYSFCCSGTGKPYGPVFTTGDTVGCIINFYTRSASFTKNGILLGVAFRDFKKSQVFPCVGLRTPGEVVETNFGALPFVFDIESYVLDERERLWKNISNIPLFPRPSIETKSLNDLIVSYLITNGYHQTAQALTNGNVDPTATLRSSQVNLQEISSHFPGIFEKYRQVYFQLQCLSFLDKLQKNQDFITFGKQLRQEFPDQLPALDELFSIVCYTQPENSPVKYLLHQAIRDYIADALNAAILDYSKLPCFCPLEKLYQQTQVVMDVLSEDSPIPLFEIN